MVEPSAQSGALALEERLVAFIRAFGLHQPDHTPCGRPIPVSEAHALMELSHGAPLGQHELARRLRLEKSTVSRLVGQLVERGWLERARDPDDGRAALLSLTPSGRRVAGELAAARSAKFASLLESIPEAERGNVLRSLELLQEALTDKVADEG